MQRPHAPVPSFHPTLRPTATAVMLLLSSMLGGQAVAQPAPASRNGGAETQSVQTLGPVKVTARRSEERAKDIPFGLTVVDGEEIRDGRMNSLEDVLRSTPGVNVNSSGGPNVSTIYIRGVGALYPMSMDDSSVAVNIDGSPISARNISLGTLDTDQIEILKGPQGTLFGGLGEAGGVNITTRKPTRHAEGYLRTEAGQDSQHLVEGAFGGPLGDRLSGRFAIRQAGSDHWVTNLANDSAVTKPRELSFRGSLLWDITTDTSALLTAERHDIRRSTELFVLRPYDDTPVVDMTPGLYNDNRKTVDRYALQVDHRLASSRLSSTTAWTHSKNIAPVVYDQRLYQRMYGMPGEYWNLDQSDERVINQDLRWSSLPDAPVFWVAGLSLSHADRSYDTPRNTFGDASAKFRDFTNKRYGLYGEMTYPLADALKLTAGLRQSWDRKTYDGHYHGNGSVVDDHRSLSDRFTTGRVGLSYAVTPSTNLYATLARGYNAGGFNDYAAQPTDSVPYRAAVTHSIEVGFKTESAAHGLALDGAIYLNKVKDNHLLSYDSFTFVTSAVNADTRSQGAELQASWAAARGLVLSGGLSYIDAEITTGLTGVGGGDVRAGNRVPDISRWSGHLAATYRQPLPAFLGLRTPMLNAQVRYQHVGARAADPQNHFELNSYGKLDMRIGVASGNAEFYVWGNNLLDKRYDLYGYYASPMAIYGAPARGRTLGVGFLYTL